MSLTNIVRLMAGVATFAITARVLGLERYGSLMLWMSVGSILALLSNYGLVTLLLKRIGERPEEASTILGEALTARLIVVGAAAAIALAGLPLVPGEFRLAFLLLTGAMMAEGFSEFFNAGFRAQARFGTETRIALVAAWLYPVSVGTTAWSTGSVTAIATAYFLSRSTITWLTWKRLGSVIGRMSTGSFRDGLRLLWTSRSYAVDGALSGVFGQLDSVVLNHYLGPIGVGIHQAGMRLFLAGAGFASVLANVFLPRAAAAHASSHGTFVSENRRLQGIFLASGALGGATLSIGGGWFAPILFGADFAPVARLMPWFGLLFMTYFAGEAWSISLTAQGLQGHRARIHAVYWVVILLMATVTVPRLGNRGWLFALIVGSIIRFGLYVFIIRRRGDADRRMVALAMILCCLFIPFLSLH